MMPTNIIKLPNETTEESATLDLRFMRGKLQQKWRIYISQSGFPVSTTDEWRDVPEAAE